MRVTPEQAVASAACPKCAAPEGSPCTYLPYNQGPQGPRWHTTQTARYQRVGTPMPGVHPERRQVIRVRNAMRRSRERKAQVIRARREEQAAWAGCEARAVSQALRAFDLAEYRQMREWLRVNGHILRNAGGRGT